MGFQTNIAAEIEKASQLLLTEKPRGHLGASQLGGNCARATWYAFRWAFRERVEGRMRRLWSRGHEEEDRIIRWLRGANYEIRDYSQRLIYSKTQADVGLDYACVDWEEEIPEHYVDVSASPHHIAIAKEKGLGPKQWNFRGDQDSADPVMSHFAGSCDGKIRGPHLPPGWGLEEFKTHNDKSFKMLNAQGVIKSKPAHFIQMQMYMHYMKLDWALYVAVNKNDDELYFELVRYEPYIAAQAIDLARVVLTSREAPKKISQDPSFFECKWCAYSSICHYGELPAKSCRACVFAGPAGKKTWYCRQYNQTIPDNFVPEGCANWGPIQ